MLLDRPVERDKVAGKMVRRPPAPPAEMLGATVRPVTPVPAEAVVPVCQAVAVVRRAAATADAVELWIVIAAFGISISMLEAVKRDPQPLIGDSVPEDLAVAEEPADREIRLRRVRPSMVAAVAVLAAGAFFMVIIGSGVMA